MTLRDAIRAALSGGDSSALAEVGRDEVGQALTSYADTSSLNEADALAPLVTRMSPVPFDPELDGDLGAPIGDVHAEVAALDDVDMADAIIDGLVDDDVDPSVGIDHQPSASMGNDADDLDPDAFDRVDRDPDGVIDGRDIDDDIEATLDLDGSGDDGLIDEYGMGQARTDDVPPAAESSTDPFDTDPAFRFDSPGPDAINDMELDRSGLADDTAAEIDLAVDAEHDAASLDADADLDFDA